MTPSTPPSAAARPPSKILVASDLSAAADRALAEADRRAREAGAELMVVHAVPHHDAIRMLFPQRLVEDIELAAELPVKAREMLEQHVARVCADPSRVILRLERGATADEALRVAEEWGAELIVVGAAPDDTADAGRIVRHAHVPVLVVRGEAGDGPVVVGTDFSRSGAARGPRRGRRGGAGRRAAGPGPRPRADPLRGDGRRQRRHGPERRLDGRAPQGRRAAAGGDVRRARRGRRAGRGRRRAGDRARRRGPRARGPADRGRHPWAGPGSPGSSSAASPRPLVQHAGTPVLVVRLHRPLRAPAAAGSRGVARRDPLAPERRAVRP